MDDLIRFVKARLDEDERWATGEDYDRHLAALRAIVDACERSLASIPVGHRANFAKGVLGHIAAIWGSHPDYRPGWSADPLPYLRDVPTGGGGSLE